jgi:hypothetical protein
MFPRASLLALAVAAVASAQQIGTLTAESHPKLTASTVSDIHWLLEDYALMFMNCSVHDLGWLCQRPALGRP